MAIGVIACGCARPRAVLASRNGFTNEEGEVTKSELVDQVADRAELTKQDASRAVDAVLATVEDALRRGSEVTVSGFGKFHVSERGARAGRQPAHRRAHPDRGLARAALHRGQRPEERGEGPLTPARSFGDTLAARVAERESQIVLGLDPDPRALWPRRRRARRDGEPPPAQRGGRGGARALPRADRRRPRRRAWRSSCSSRASRCSAPPAGRRCASGRRARARRRPARDRRRQARRHRRHRARLRRAPCSAGSTRRSAASTGSAPTSRRSTR